MKYIARYIAVDPRICRGKPHFQGTRILVHAILELLEARVPAEEITGKMYYPTLTQKHIEAALHHASELLKSRAYVPQGTLR